MYTNLSEIQKQYFYNLCGETHQSSETKGRFETSKPYNNEYYKFSPWGFEYFFDVEKGYLICILSHHMTDNRIYGWDHRGNEISDYIISEYFKGKKVA
ncbi:hypothetical protein [Labilibaculum euxinus]